MSDIFTKFDNLPDDYVPNNEPINECCCSNNDFIITGQSVSQSFNVPFNVETDLLDYELIYKTGVDFIIRRGKSELETFIMEDNTSIITCSLSSDDTKKFDNTLLDTFAQFKFTMLDGTCTYSDIYKIKVLNSLEYTQSFKREGEKEDGNA